MSMKQLVNFFFCHFLFRVHYTGLENLEKAYQVLICPNHSCIFDPFFIYPVCQDLSIMAKAELFKNPILAKIFQHYHVFPVDRTRKDPKSLWYCLDWFKTNQKRELLIFPEGGIVKTEAEICQKVRNGATFLSAQIGIPILPVYITRRPKFFSKVTVTFGKPFQIEKEVLKDKPKLKEQSKELIQKIYQLKGKTPH